MRLLLLSYKKEAEGGEKTREQHHANFASAFVAYGTRTMILSYYTTVRSLKK